MAETGRRGVGTGMSDIQRDLRWQNPSGGWSNWVNMGCFYDDSVGGGSWNGQEVSGNRYETRQASQSCPLP